MTETELHWLAGLLEGEGSFVSGPPSRPRDPQISVQMCDEDVVARVATLFHVKYYACKRQRRYYKRPWRTTLIGQRAVALMKILRPFMGTRRQQQIDRAVASHRPDPNHWSRKASPSTARMRKLRERGWSYRRIARRLGCSHQLVAKRLGP